MQPDLRHATEIRQGRLEYAGKIGGEDDVIGLGDIDTVRQRRADQLGVDQRSDAANPADAEPGRDIIRTVRQEQANRIAASDPRLQRPARIAVDTLSEFGVAQGQRVRQQRGMLRLFVAKPSTISANRRCGSLSIRDVRSIAFSQLLAADGLACFGRPSSAAAVVLTFMAVCPRIGLDLYIVISWRAPDHKLIGFVNPRRDPDRVKIGLRAVFPASSPLPQARSRRQAAYTRRAPARCR